MLHDVVIIGCDFGDAIKPNDHGIFSKLRHCLCDEHCLKSNSYGWDARVKDRWWLNKFDHANKWGAWFGYKRHWFKKINHRKKM